LKKCRERQALERNKRLVDEFLDTREDLRSCARNLAIVRFPRVINGTSDALCDLLRKKYDTSVAPGRFFEMPAHFRLGIAGGSDVLEKGLEKSCSGFGRTQLAFFFRPQNQPIANLFGGFNSTASVVILMGVPFGQLSFFTFGPAIL
jgi:hypothetical protein